MVDDMKYYTVTVTCKHCGIAMSGRRILHRGDDYWCTVGCLLKDLGIDRQVPQIVTLPEDYEDADQETPY